MARPKKRHCRECEHFKKYGAIYHGGSRASYACKHEKVIWKKITAQQARNCPPWCPMGTARDLIDR